MFLIILVKNIVKIYMIKVTNKNSCKKQNLYKVRMIKTIKYHLIVMIFNNKMTITINKINLYKLIKIWH